jgi:hypothetical protein
MRKQYWLALIVIFAATLYLFQKNTLAAQAPTGITVSPAFQQVNLQAGESQHPVNFTVTNNKGSAQTLDLSSADFNTLNESGGLLFVGTNPTKLQEKYGLAKWLSLPQKQITIPAKQTVTINAVILNQSDMPAGGHYGALMLALAGNGNQSSGNNIAVHPIASSLIFVTKIGGDTHKLGLIDVNYNHSIYTQPSDITLRFKNIGNTHLIPRGSVTIKSSSGKLINKGIINDDSGIILPETFRQYHVPLKQINSSLLPGRYKIKIDYRFDGFNQYRTYVNSYWYTPLWTMLILVIAVFILVWYFLRKRLKNN